MLRPDELYSAIDRSRPETLAGAVIWDRSVGEWRLRFIGRGVDSRAALPRLTPGSRSLAWMNQRHGREIVTAVPGDCGEADALWIDTPHVVAVVATADCVPVAVSAGSRAALIHAGWRGLAAGLVADAADRLGAGESAEAWIGPAIGPCCYEVGAEVAEKVVRACDGAAVREDGDRIVLDLRLAAALQLRAAGVRRVRLLDCCTRCHGEWLWSHRRQRGRGDGRNFTLLWRSENGAGKRTSAHRQESRP